ncbi:MAG: hypothetical protein ACOCYN_00870 [Planctomycetota bacterium]
MPRARPLTALFLFLLCACGGGDGTRVGTPPPLGRASVVTTVLSVAERDGVQLVELPVGRSEDIALGDFFRVYGQSDAAPLKGMLQVTDILGDHRSLARMIGLYDRNDPLAPDDEARLVRDLRTISQGAEVEQAARDEARQLEQEGAATQEEFAGLRASYQRRIEQLRQDFDERTAAIVRDHEQAVTALEQRHQRALERKDAERKSDLATLRATLMSEARTSLRQSQNAKEEEIRRLRGDLRKAQERAADLVREQQGLRERVERLVAQAATAKREFQAEIRAEAETRQVLERRIAQFEGRIDTELGSEQSVLPNDPDRDETILERLDRITRERDAARSRNAQLVTDLEHRQGLLEQGQERIATLEQKLGVLERSDSDRADLAGRLAEAESAIASLQRHTKALELLRLQTERACFDLARRILLLPVGQPAAIEDLQQRVRELFAAEGRELPDTEGQ